MVSWGLLRPWETDPMWHNDRFIGKVLGLSPLLLHIDYNGNNDKTEPRLNATSRHGRFQQRLAEPKLDAK